MARNIFRAFQLKGEGKDETRVEKRRAQLRQAQQTYRDRKDKYTKALEQEVSKIRAREAGLLREVQRLQAGIESLLTYIQQHGLEASEEVYSPRSENSLTAAQPLIFQSPSPSSNIQQPTQTRTLGSPETALQRFPPKWSLDGPLIRTPERPVAADNSSWLKGNPDIGRRDDGDGSRLGDLDPVIVGMEFVLTLERPCLAHLHGDPDKPHEPGCHALTTTAQLLSVCPPSSTELQTVHKSFHRDVPTATLESLLSLSSELSSDQEVTPVQAWYYIRSQPHFGGLELGNLQVLAESLREAVKCHGFGAVISQELFQQLVHDALLSGRLF